jgi:glutamate-ammonia-ligase adenylyltransferase
MKHDPAVSAAAGLGITISPNRYPGAPESILAELERLHAQVRPLFADVRFAHLFVALDSFTTLASDLITGFGDPASLPPSARRSLDSEYGALQALFAQADRIVARTDRAWSPDRIEETVAAAEMLSAIALLRADALCLHDNLVRALRRALHPDAHDPLEIGLIEAGFADPITGARRLREWGDGVPHAMHRASERRAFEAVLPRLVSAIARLPDPDAALCALDEIICRLPPDISLFGVLEAQPVMMVSLVELLGHAPALSRHLIAQPALVGRLLDGGAYAPLPPLADIESELTLAMAGPDPKAAAARLAQAVNSYRFGLGLQVLEGTADPIDLAAHTANLAETALRVMAHNVIARFEEAHGRIPGSELVILGLGRFGGGSLTYRSDLDLIYLFAGDHRAQSDGRKPLDANEYFSRIAQQVTLAMTTATTLGPLYEIDTRLRPWGAKGLLACSTACFGEYHAETAWTWEHMALTRARPIFGSEAVLREAEQIIDNRLRQPRDRATLLSDAGKMRGDMARHKPGRGPFDVKLIEGGLVDLEFAVHVHQLGHHVGLHPRLRTAVRALIAAGLFDPALLGAHDLLSRMLVTLQLLSPHSQEPAVESQTLIARACRQPSWDALLVAYGQARCAVRDAWRHAISKRSC